MATGLAQEEEVSKIPSYAKNGGLRANIVHCSKDTFVWKMVALLKLERDEEISQTKLLLENVHAKELERKGVCLLKLRLSSRHTGLYGRSVLVFEPFWQGKELPSHSLTPGDIVGLCLSQSEGAQDQLSSGLVSRVNQTSVSVAFDESYDSLDLDEDTQYKLTKLANDVTYKRIKRALDKLSAYISGPSSLLIDVMFGEATPSPPMMIGQDIVFINTRLDESQKDAVRFAIDQKELAIIHGPPGTGKTTTVVEIIIQAIKQGLKVLVCAPSNIAVDNLVERLASYKKKVVRLGHPARLLAHIQRHSLDAIISASDETKLVEDVRRDLDRTLSQLKKCRGQGERQKLREEMKHLRREMRQREGGATEHVLKAAEVVTCTLTSATDDGPLKYLDEGYFDLVVIDECSQALEAACWIALTKAPRCVLAGDHLQLPPTILSQKAAKEGLEVTLIERQLSLHGDQVMRMLTTQYRMHELIMRWSSDQLYHGRLVADPSVAGHLLRDLPDVDTNEDTGIPLLLIDTAGCSLHELDLPEEVSKGNEGEADLVSVHVDRLISSGLKPQDIAVIAPYNLQVDLLRVRLSQKFPQLEIKSVDGFQGREKEAVIISLVRSNDRGEIGFLAEDRRMNVAITRARRHLAVIGDTITVSHHQFLKSLVEYMMQHGDVRSAHEYTEEFSIGQERTIPVHIQEKQKRMQDGSSKKKPAKLNKKSRKINISKTCENSACAVADKESSAASVWKEELQNIVQSFLVSENETVHPFPASLTSEQRFFVHEAAEAVHLQHYSQGEGESRHIVIAKVSKNIYRYDNEQTGSERKVLGKPADTAVPGMKNTECRSQEFSRNIHTGVTNAFQALLLPDDTGYSSKVVTKDESYLGDQDHQNKSKEEVGTKTCTICGKQVPEQNIELHTLRCAKLRNSSVDKDPPVTSVVPTEAKKKKKKSKPVNATAALQDTSADDFDALIAEASKLNSKCNFPKCKMNVLTLGMNCEFCAQRFCLSHHIPEVHGCGDMARDEARRRISREGVLYSGSGKKNFKPDPTRRGHLQRKLDKKVDELADQRKRKQKENR